MFVITFEVKKEAAMFFFKTAPPQHILVAREDAMGDVILAMPVCGLIKKYYPSCKIYFLGQTYTKAVALCCEHIDEFINYDDWKKISPGEVSRILHEKKIDTVVHLLQEKGTVILCSQAKIRYRIGPGNVLRHWRYCNRIVMLSRKKSRLNEAQLNIKLLRPLSIKERPRRDQVPQYYGFTKIPLLEPAFGELLQKDKFNLILHPLSNKNAKEWGLHNFSALVSKIDKNKTRIFITGSLKEKDILSEWIASLQNEVTDLTGALSTEQLIAFIAAGDGLIAASTGPVHIAAAAGIYTLGLYEDRWSKRGERWGPLGNKATYLQCVNEDMDTITPAAVLEEITKWGIHKKV